MHITKDHADMVTALVKSGDDILDTLSPQAVNLWYGVTGVVGEAGELIDAVKKHVIYGKKLDIDNIIEELGDIEFYMEQVRQELNITREQTLLSNIKKLTDKNKGRYPNGYTDAAAISRADKQEQVKDINHPDIGCAD